MKTLYLPFAALSLLIVCGSEFIIAKGYREQDLQRQLDEAQRKAVVEPSLAATPKSNAGIVPSVAGSIAP